MRLLERSDRSLSIALEVGQDHALGDGSVQDVFDRDPTPLSTLLHSLN